MVNPLTYATTCSGVEAVSLAWEPLGFKPAWYSEIEPFPNAVLAHHWPQVPNLGDMTAIDGKLYAGKIDILWGSTPCQAFSVSGRRRGLEDARGKLTMSFANLADDIDPPFLCWENVLGALSDENNAFGCYLGALSGEDVPLVPPGGRWTDAGYVLGPRRAIAWRVLDSRHFGVAQSRPRVFLVACPRSGADPRAVLFEHDPTRVDVPPRPGDGEGSVFWTQGGLDEWAGAFPVAFRGRDSGTECEVGEGETAFCLRASQGGSDKLFVLQRHYGDWYIRQVSERECERLMGMPDDHTLVPYPSKSISGARYKAIGNSLAVPVVRWLGRRLQMAAEGNL